MLKRGCAGMELEADESMQTTPPKNPRREDEINGKQQTPQTPSPSRLVYQMNVLDAALAHYFSPKRKSPSRIAGRAQRRLNFELADSEQEEEEDILISEQNMETSTRKPEVQKFVGKGPLDCNISSIRHCFNELDNYLPKNLILKEKELILFQEWFNLLSSGEFNILVHGLGSKRKLFENFREFLSSYHCFVIDGLFSGISISAIFEQIEINLGLKLRVKFKTKINDWAKDLIDKIREKEFIFILINHIDSPQLRSRQQQEALSILVRSKKIRLIASVDHVNAALIWDQSLRDAFNWLYFPVSTLNCYGNEVFSSNGNILDHRVKGISGRAHTIESLDVFWQATTSNMRKILEQLAIHAPMFSERFKWDSLNIPKFCRILKEEFATTSETVLRQQLIEFRDHSIIQFNKDEHILLTVERNLLVNFLEQKLKQND
ncbi:hypothetical protein ACQ4LE_008292 [Meloidogyne hapla]|uniref:Origin recognition complex subunit 2 n=1 Tax=Meloidogyne hapla TaxID=6305 RepID=A0A1I8B334_MELHA